MLGNKLIVFRFISELNNNVNCITRYMKLLLTLDVLTAWHRLPTIFSSLTFSIKVVDSNKTIK